MAFTLRRPILIGGLGLVVGGWIFESLHPATTHLGGTLLWGAIALGSGVWWLKHQFDPPLELKLPTSPVDRSRVAKTLAEIEALLNQLETERQSVGSGSLQVAELRQQLTDLIADLDRQQIRFAVMGNRSVGKTTLVQHLTQHLTQPSQAENNSAALTSAESGEAEQTDGQAADLVLFVTTGDLTSSEMQSIQALLDRPQRVLLLFNKQDQYLPADRPVILQQLRQRVKELLDAEDVLAIATQPAPVKVRQYQADGSVQELIEQPAADLTALTTRLQTLLATESQALICNTVQRQALSLRTTILKDLNQFRRDRALPQIEQAQWIAAAAAFANPVPTLDLVATAAINTQMIVDLGELYQQKFSLEQAKTIAATLASQMVKLGLVEMTSQAVTPLLKSNTLTYVAGGLMQGIGAAYLTRLAGLSLVSYFEEQTLNPALATDSFQFDRLVKNLQAVFQDNQRTAFLQTLAKQAIGRLVPNATAIAPTAAQ